MSFPLAAEGTVANRQSQAVEQASHAASRLASNTSGSGGSRISLGIVCQCLTSVSPWHLILNSFILKPCSIAIYPCEKLISLLVITSL